MTDWAISWATKGGRFPVVIVVVGLPGCHSRQQLVKRTQLQGEVAPLMWVQSCCWLKEEKKKETWAYVHKTTSSIQTALHDTNHLLPKMFILTMQYQKIWFPTRPLTMLYLFTPLFFIRLNIFEVLWGAIIDRVTWSVTSHITLIAGDWSEKSHLIRWTNFHVGTVWNEWGYFLNRVYLAFWWLHIEGQGSRGSGNARPAAHSNAGAKNEYVLHSP